MADWGTYTLLDQQPAVLTTVNWADYTPTTVNVQLPLSMTILPILAPLIKIDPGSYWVVGTAPCPECPECPDCPPPARFSLALGATPLGLALGASDT